MVKKQLTPQEKKVLSYLKDRRNMYGESRSSAIKTIRRRKAIVNRQYRRAVAQQIKVVGITTSSEETEVSAQTVTRKVWRKSADRPLVEYVEGRLRRRQQMGINLQQRSSQLIKEAKRRLRQNRRQP